MFGSAIVNLYRSIRTGQRFVYAVFVDRIHVEQKYSFGLNKSFTS